MGRKKIQISRITDERNRQVTFNKRKFGVMKKAYELSVLCDCEIALIIFSSSNKLYQYASTDMDKVLLKYTEYNEPHESLTNKNIIEKEHKNGNCNSPESPDPDPEYSLTPRTEAKYSKIDEEFQMMMQRNHLNGNRSSIGQSSYSMPVSMPVNSSYGDSTSSLMQPSPQMPHGSVSPRPSSSGTDPGGLLDMSNGYPPSSSPLPLPLSASPSSLHGGVGSNNNSTNKGGGKLSPGSSGRPTLRVVIPSTSQAALSLDDAPSISQAEHNRAAWVQAIRGNSTLGVSGGLNTPVISLQTPTIPGMSNYNSTLPNAFAAQDFSVNSDLGLSNLNALHQWNTSGQLTSANLNPARYGSLAHLAMSNSTPPPQSASPLSVRIKSEPISPPREGGNSSHQPRPSSTGHLSPAGHLTPGRLTPSSHSSPSDTHSHHSDYDSLPLHKRPRLTEGWAT